jgi:hypothetical protein
MVTKSKKIPLTPEQKLLRALRRRGVMEWNALPDGLRELNEILVAVRVPFRAEMLADGSRVLRDRKGRVVFQASPQAERLETKPSIAQPPVHACSPSAARQRTIEAYFNDIIAPHLPDRAGLRAAIASAFFKGFWFTAPADEAKLTAAAVRKVNLNMRGKASSTIGACYAVGEEEGRYARRAVDAFPGITALATTADILAAYKQNISVAELTKRLGGDTALKHLKTPAHVVLNLEAVAAVTEALAVVATTGEMDILSGTGQRRWLDAVLPYLLLEDEPAPGFKRWLALKSYLYGGDMGLPAAVSHVRLWAAVTHGQRGGWSNALEWHKAKLLAETWAEGQRAQRKAMAKALAKGEVVNAPAVFMTCTVDVFVLRQLMSERDIFDAGTELGVCLASRSAYFQARAMWGASMYLAMHEAVTPKGEKGGQVEAGKLLAVAEVALAAGRPMQITEFRGRRNTTPPPRQRRAIEDWLLAERLTAKVGVMPAPSDPTRVTSIINSNGMV